MSGRKSALLTMAGVGGIVAVAAAALLTRRLPGDGAAHRTEDAPARAPAPAPFKTTIPYDEARPLLEAMPEKLPAELKMFGGAGTSRSRTLETAWPGWASRHNAEIRARLERGDEDSIVNFWIYGTTFTKRPRATRRDLAAFGRGSSAEETLLGRLDDLLAALASPADFDAGTNERLRFVRQVIERRGIDPTTSAGKDQARVYLIEARERVLAENERYGNAARSARRSDRPADELSAYATLYRDRGLSSDTSLPADFALERTLEDIKAKGRLGAGSVRRVAIVGPGLDFTDKAEGYDFYPQQTIQPFAVIDSLIRLGLAKPDDLRLTTFDLSPRVNQHLEAARERARGGAAYVLQLPFDSDRPWVSEFVKYWRRFGDSVGDEVEARAPPSVAGAVRVRAVRVRPTVVLSIVPRDLNIVLERLDPLAKDERFDVIVATNILVYYDAFEQALALANVSKMLRPGGFFLTNYMVTPRPPMESSPSLLTKVFWDRQQNGDTLFWYRAMYK